MKTIKDMPEHSRPREKLREKGASALTDQELVAAILSMGTAGVDVRTIARHVASLIRQVHSRISPTRQMLDMPVQNSYSLRRQSINQGRNSKLEAGKQKVGT